MSLAAWWKSFTQQSHRTQPQPQDEAVPLVFEPLITFTAPEFHSVYVHGLQYTVRAPGSILHRTVEKWVRQRKVKWVEGARSRLTGTGG